MIGLRESEVTLLDSKQSVNAADCREAGAVAANGTPSRMQDEQRRSLSAQHSEIARTISTCLGDRSRPAATVMGLVVELAPFRNLLSGGRACARIGV